MMMVSWCAVIASLLFASMAYAQADTPVVDRRQANQEQRIDRGLASGQLTDREANRLTNQQEHIDRMEDKAKSDGAVTRKERTKLHTAQDRASRHIAREKHDRQGARRQ